jgi:hypothetical protein
MDVGNQYGYQCPYCNRGTDLLVAARVEILLTPNGTDIDATTTPVWSQTSFVDCLNCGWAGKVGDLKRWGSRNRARQNVLPNAFETITVPGEEYEGVKKERLQELCELAANE